MKKISQLFGTNKKTSEKAKAKKKTASRRKLSPVYAIVALVAILECLILISYTTFSWIETASSLKILSGKKYIVDDDNTMIPIKNALNYQFRIGSATYSTNDENCADLNEFFSECGKDLYRYAETSSPDGKTFYFANPSTAHSSFRKGDTTDYNTSYTFFDFTVQNGTGSKYRYADGSGDNSNAIKVQFQFADNDIFSVSPGTSGLSQPDCDKIRDAMRLSIQSGGGSPKIYSETAATYDAQSATTENTTSSVTTTAIEQNKKVFAVAKNGKANIACRIWFEKNAPSLSGSGITDAQLAGVNINVDFKLKYVSNEFDFIYFDDYTFSNARANNGGHLTEDHLDENGNDTDSYRMYFVYKSNGNSTGGTVYPMTLDPANSNADAVRWVTCDPDGTPEAKLPASYYSSLTGTGTQNSYFAYGPLSKASGQTETDALKNSMIYTWKLSNYNNSDGIAKASEESELIYNAFGLVQTASGSPVNFNSGANVFGAGGWACSTPLSMVYFRDAATGLTNQPYNTGSSYQYITNAVNVAADTDPDASLTRSNVLFVNYASSGSGTTRTISSAQYGHTASMYYDKSLDGGKGLFKAWVPSYWLTRDVDTEALMFRYCPNNLYAGCVAAWPSPQQPTVSTGSSDYIYTALGYAEQYITGYYGSSNNNSYIATGTGTWRKLEASTVSLSSELIDNYMKPGYRFQIGVKIFQGSTQDTTYTYYSLIPDETNTKFYAYIPDPKDGNSQSSDSYAASDIIFRAFSYGDSSNTPVAKAAWTPAYTRNGSNTFYPVKFLTNASDASDTSRGYWHISVIVDGTYEHLFWENAIINPNTQAVIQAARVLGSFKFNTTGHPATDNASAYTDITAYSLDEYRWYVPLENSSEYIYYRWEPYTGTVLKFNHNTNDGIYCVVTEAPDDVPDLYDATS